MKTLNEIRDAVHALAKAKGWYETPRDLDPVIKLALIHSEVSEALEEIRSEQIRVGCIVPRFDGLKPVGLPAELADIIIRTLDLAGALGIDIEAAVELKHAYNATRPHRHGGKAL